MNTTLNTGSRSEFQSTTKPTTSKEWNFDIDELIDQGLLDFSDPVVVPRTSKLHLDKAFLLFIAVLIIVAVCAGVTYGLTVVLRNVHQRQVIREQIVQGKFTGQMPDVQQRKKRALVKVKPFFDY